MTLLRKLAIVAAVLAAIAAGGSQMHSFLDPFGGSWPLIVNAVAGLSGLAGTIVASVLAAIAGVDNQVAAIPALAQTPAGQRAVLQAVNDMPGVDEVHTNANANPTLQKAVADQALPKIT